MRHYEVVFLVHPDQTEQVPGMVERYKNMIESKNGTVTRLEDWGRLQLAYLVQKLHKAHFILMNITCSSDVLKELTTAFKFNDAVIRHLVINVNEAITQPSIMMKEEKSKNLLSPAQ